MKQNPTPSVGGYTGEAQQVVQGVTVADAWDALTADHVVANSFGARLGVPQSVIKSIQRGTMSMAASIDSATSTVSAVVLGKSFISFLGFDMNDNSAVIRSRHTKGVLTNTTTITFTRVNAGAGAIVISWELIEYE